MTGESPGTLSGVPISFKDCIDTKGIRTTSGSRVDSERIPDEDAEVVRLARTAGAVHLGKNNLHEFAMGITSNNLHFGPVRNPWNTRLIAGGSSGGSAAAVAADLCAGSIGTDTSGSIRIPASCCGVSGLKPTYGLVSLKGIVGLSWTLDHAGPMARNVEDLALILEALTNQKYKLTNADLQGVRIGVPTSYFTERMDPEIAVLYSRALRQLADLKAEVVEIPVPVPRDMLRIARTIGTSEVSYLHQERRLKSLDLYEPSAKETFERSRHITLFEYFDALKRREMLAHQWDDVFSSVDIVATPTLPIFPPELGVSEAQIGNDRENLGDCMVRFTQLFALTGHPALSVPCGLSDQGIPAGLQFAAARFREDLLLRTAYAYEQAALRSLYARRDALWAE